MAFLLDYLGFGSRRDRVKLAGNAVGCTGSTAATPHPTCSSASSSRCSRTEIPGFCYVNTWTAAYPPPTS